MARVVFGAVLRDRVPAGTIEMPARTLDELLDGLESRYPKLRFRIRDETGTLRRYMRLFVNGTDVRTLSGLSTPLTPSDTVDILHSIQGG